MQTYANILLIAIPVFLVLILIEALYGYLKGKNTLRGLDTISSLSSGITNIVKDSLGLIVIILSYEWLVSHLAIFRLESQWALYVVGFIAIDFAGYWTHRLSHSINLFWNGHAVHHSSEEFNLPCALRQPISNLIGIYSFFLLPAALLGVPAQVIETIAPLHLFLQFWYHTRHIGKMGWLEYIIITPSQHRVHHAINPEYLDKNLGQIFSFWDRMFGTFQEELDDVPPVYGITRPMRTWNPIKINFKHAWLMISDAIYTSSIKDKLVLWFKPLGYRPKDRRVKAPVYKIEDPYRFEKYHTSESRFLLFWSWGQLFFSLLLLCYMFWQFTAIGFPLLMLYGLYLFLSVYGFTSVMDGDRAGIVIDIIRNIYAIGLILIQGGWFNMNEVGPFLSLIVFVYSMVSLFGSVYFFIQSRKKAALTQS